MFVHESGTVGRPTIVFLHSIGANGIMWNTHMDKLADYHYLVPDFPGFGLSNDQKWSSISETTNQVIDIIRDRAHIVGISLGGNIAITLLSNAPDLVDHAIIAGLGFFLFLGYHLLI
jgi:pimeloyl-ACP methyl ester carboxylesterase